MQNRRQVLARSAVAAAALLGAGVVALPGCAREGSPPGDLDRALGDEEALIDAYEKTLRAHPAAATVLGPLRDNHIAHRDEILRLRGRGPDRPRADGPSTAPVPDTVDPDPLRAVAALGALEQAAAGRARQRCAATVGEPAGTHASIAACEASHAVVLAAAPAALTAGA